jgi:hypothetical protein
VLRTSSMRDDVQRALLRAATERRTVTYGFLMSKFRLSRGAPAGNGVVGVIGVRKDTGYPGGGFFCWNEIPPALRRARREGSNPRLSDAEKRYVRRLQEEIWGYYGGELRDHSA